MAKIKLEEVTVMDYETETSLSFKVNKKISHEHYFRFDAKLLLILQFKNAIQ